MRRPSRLSRHPALFCAAADPMNAYWHHIGHAWVDADEFAGCARGLQRLRRAGVLRCYRRLETRRGKQDRLSLPPPRPERARHRRPAGTGHAVPRTLINEISTHTIAYNEPGAYTVKLEVTNAGNEVAAWSNVLYRAPLTVHVSATGTQIFPFESPETGTRSIQTGIAAAAVTVAATSSVAVAAGTFLFAERETIQHYKPILIRGAGQDQTIINLQRQTDTRSLDMWHAGAVFDGFVVTNGFTGSANSRATGAMIKAGTLRDSWIVGHEAGYNPGTGIYMESGLIDRCRITSNKSRRDGTGVQLVGGTMRNSLVAFNRSTETGNFEGSAVRIHSGARGENCTVVDNERIDTTFAGVNVLSGGALVNSIVWYNRLYSGTPADIAGAGVSAGVTYSAAPELNHDPDGTGNLSAIAGPGFADRPGGNYRLAEGSPCFWAGTLLGWMPGFDLDGNPRPWRVPDMGAYEIQPPCGTLLLLR